MSWQCLLFKISKIASKWLFEETARQYQYNWPRAMHLPQDAYVRLNLVRLIPAIYIVARCRMAIGNFGQRWCFTKRVLVGGFTGPDLFDRNLWLSQWPWLETTCGYRASPGSDGLSQALPKLRPLQMAKGRAGNRAALLPEFDSRVIVGPTAFLAALGPLFIPNSP